MDRRERKTFLHFLPARLCPESSLGQRLPSSSFRGQWSREQEGESRSNRGEPAQVCTVGLEDPAGSWCLVPRGRLRSLRNKSQRLAPRHEREAE